MIKEGDWKLIKARIEAMPPNMKLSIGSFGTFNKQQIMESLEKKDEVGKIVVEMQLNYIKKLKDILKKG